MGIELLIKYWREIFIVSIIVGFVYKWNSIVNEIDDLKEEKVKLEVEIRELKSVIDGLDKVLTHQNNEVYELHELSKKQDKKLKKAEKESNKLEEKYKKEIRKLLSESVPITCKGASNWSLNKALEGEFKWSK